MAGHELRTPLAVLKTEVELALWPGRSKAEMADALRQVMVGATPQFSLGVDVAAMVAFLAVLSIAAVRLFQWE